MAWIDISERRDRRDELAAERYSALFAQVEDEQREEWEAEFSFPFQANGAQIHRIVMQRMSTMRD